MATEKSSRLTMSTEVEEEYKQAMAKMIEQKKKAALDDPLRSPYVMEDFDVVEDVISACKRHLEGLSEQTYSFVALVQATMSGKTRLLQEICARRPLIIIAFKNNNAAYDQLKASLRPHKVKTTTFDERMLHNRWIFLKVRLFLISFLDFADRYCQVYQKTSLLDLTYEQREVFFALLINGGSTLVSKLFEERLKMLPENITEIKEEQLKALQTQIREIHRWLVISLGTPWYALDECHVLYSWLCGFLFHSDYKKRLEACESSTLFAWQQYEEKKQVTLSAPQGYPYCLQTSLFSAFRWILEQSLKESDEKARQMTIFATTHYSAWGPLLDIELYSREKPKISLYDKLPTLRLENLNTLLCNSLKFPVHVVESDEVRKQLSRFTGRPGFFFDFAWRQLKEISAKIETLTSVLLEQILVEIAGRVLNESITGMLSHMASSSYATSHPPKSDLINRFQYIRKLHNMQMKRNEEWSNSFVEAGLALRRTNNEAGKQLVQSIFVDPLVLEYLDQQTKNQKSTLETELLKYVGNTNHGELAELGIALQVLANNEELLLQVIDSWTPIVSLPTKTRDILESFSVSVERVASMDELELAPPNLLNALLKNTLLRPKTELTLPDATFIARSADQPDDLVFVEIQSKAWKSKLSNTVHAEKPAAKANIDNAAAPTTEAGPVSATTPKSEPSSESEKSKSFTHAVRSISRPDFFAGHPAYSERFQANWSKLGDSKKVLHIRVVFCWAGFTDLQIKAITKFNEDYPEQPIVLVGPSPMMLGQGVYDALRKEINEPKPQEKSKKENQTNMQPMIAAVTMTLLDWERGWFAAKTTE